MLVARAHFFPRVDINGFVGSAPTFGKISVFIQKLSSSISKLAKVDCTR